MDNKINEKLDRKRECKIELKYNELLKKNNELKQQLVVKKNEIKLKNSMIIDMDDKIKICNRELFLAKSKKSDLIRLASKPKKEKKHKRIIDSYYTFDIIDINDEDFMVKLNDYQNKLNESIQLNNNHVIVAA